MMALLRVLLWIILRVVQSRRPNDDSRNLQHPGSFGKSSLTVGVSSLLEQSSRPFHNGSAAGDNPFESKLEGTELEERRLEQDQKQDHIDKELSRVRQERIEALTKEIKDLSEPPNGSEEDFVKCGKLEEELKELKRQEAEATVSLGARRSEEVMDSQLIQEKERRKTQQIIDLEKQLKSAKELHKWEEAALIKKAIQNLHDATIAPTGFNLASYKWTDEGCLWMKTESQKTFGAEIVVGVGTVMDEATLGKIKEISDTKTLDNMVADHLLVKEFSYHNEHGLQKEVAAQLESTLMKGIMRSAGGIVYETWTRSRPEDGETIVLKFRMLEMPEGLDLSTIQQKDRPIIGEIGTMTLRGRYYGYDSKVWTDENRKAIFVGEATDTDKWYLKQASGTQFLIHWFKEADSGAYAACDVTVIKGDYVQNSYFFRMRTARTALGPSRSLANIYERVITEDGHGEYMSISGARGETKVPQQWYFYATLDRGTLDMNQGTLNFRCLKAGMLQFTNFTGVEGTEKVRSGNWLDGHQHQYLIRSSNVNVPFLAQIHEGPQNAAPTGTEIRFTDVGDSGLPEAEVRERANPTRRHYEGPITRWFALWAPRQRPQGWLLPDNP